MRARRLLALATLAAVAGAALPAMAADRAVVARVDNTFAPRQVAVKPGETVTFTNRDGLHNVVWNDGREPPQPAQAAPPEQWPAGGVSRTFTRAGKYRYYCELHAGPTGDFGMVGYVHVNVPGLLPPVVRSLSVAAHRRGARIGFRSTRAGRATATFSRRVGRTYRRHASIRLAARAGLNRASVARAFPPGLYRVELRLTDAHGLASNRARASGVRVR